MNTKVKNDPKNYMTRSKLGGGGPSSSAGTSNAVQTRASQRVASGTLDGRWYLQMAPAKKG
jgi:hypothetical protein